MPTLEPAPFGAFISYRHVEPDRSLARWLHGALETYRVPAPLVASGTRSRLGRVFRDEEELAASPDLSARIDDALARADALIVICSPRTPASRWVDAEVARFVAQGRSQRIFALLIEGEPAQSFPPALLATGAEPLAADLRAQATESARETRRLALLKLLAGLLGVEFDALRRRDDERRRTRLLWLASAGTVAALVFAALALTAALQWRRAERELTIARAENLATQAQLALMQATAPGAQDSPTAPDIQRSALLALESLRLHDGINADAVLRRSLYALAPERLVATLANDEFVLGISAQGTLERVRGDAPRATAGPATDSDELARSPDGRWYLRTSDEGVRGWIFQSAALARSAAGAPVALLPHEWMIRRAAFTADGRWLVTVTGEASADAQSPSATMLVGHTVRVWNTEERREHTRLSLAAESGIGGAWIDPTGEWLATATLSADPRVVWTWPVRPARLRELACSLLKRNLSPSEWLSFVADGTPAPTCPGLPLVSE